MDVVDLFGVLVIVLYACLCVYVHMCEVREFKCMLMNFLDYLVDSMQSVKGTELGLNIYI